LRVIYIFPPIENYEHRFHIAAIDSEVSIACLMLYAFVTPCVTETLIKFINFELSLNTTTNLITEVKIRNSNEMIENSNACDCCPHGEFQNFWDFI
jgi:hypothetical protein